MPPSARYATRLPRHYSSAVHRQRLAAASHLFRRLSCGPLVQEGLEQLAGACATTWSQGRQLCEFRSVTGRPCVLPAHAVPQPTPGGTAPATAGDATPHRSQATFTCACACGRTQVVAGDPFSLADVNQAFFVERDCCAAVIRHSEVLALQSDPDACSLPAAFLHTAALSAAARGTGTKGGGAAEPMDSQSLERLFDGTLNIGGAADGGASLAAAAAGSPGGDGHEVGGRACVLRRPARGGLWPPVAAPIVGHPLLRSPVAPLPLP